MRAYLLTQGIADEIRAGVKEKLLTVLELRIINQCFEELRKLIKEVFLDGPIEAALSRLPADCGPLLSRVVRTILDGAASVRRPAPDPARRRVGPRSDYYGRRSGAARLVRHGHATRPGPQCRPGESLCRRPGQTNDAYTATRAIVVNSTEATAETGQYADLLQQRRISTRWWTVCFATGSASATWATW